MMPIRMHSQAAPNFLRYLQYAYFLRIPIFISLFISLLPLMPNGTVRGMLTLEHDRDLFILSWLSLQAAWSCMICWRIVTLNGPYRFEAEDLAIRKRRLPILLGRWLSFFSWTALALPLIIISRHYSIQACIGVEPPCKPISSFAAFLGAALAFLLLYAATLLDKWVLCNVCATERTKADEHKLILPFSDPLQRRFLNANSPGLLTLILAKLPAWAAPGYIDADGNTRPGHGIAVAITWLLAIIYISGFWLLNPTHGREFPAIGYVLVIAIIGVWVFSGIAFFLDRFRFPVLMTVLIAILLLHLRSNSDHYYELSSRRVYPRSNLNEDDSFRAWRRAHPGKKIIVVATAGGGIKAAAWTAKVLVGLEERCRGHFANSVAMISSVSGGSVGTMYFADKYRNGEYLDTEDVWNKASRSSLSEAAWGIAYPDLLRLVLPEAVFTMAHDRGWAIEQAWRRDWPYQSSIETWEQRLARGEMPAVVMNATVAETGERLLIANFTPSTTNLRRSERTDPQKSEQNGSRAWSDDKFTISTSTAARLSATFPYVTPISRGELTHGFHVADGGYNDNFGVSSAINWINKILEKEPDIQILLIEIRSSPQSSKEETDAKSWGVLEEVSGPIDTLLAVRSGAQLARNNAELSLLKEKWELVRKLNGPEQSQSPPLENVVFTYPGDAPLSWHLTQRQKSEIAQSWSQNFPSSATEVQAVQNFIGVCQD
jgi:hypothetical protein